MKIGKVARESAVVAVLSVLAIHSPKAWSEDSATGIFKGSVSGGAETSVLAGAGQSYGGSASLRLEEGRAGTELQQSCDYGGFVLGLLTLGAGGMGRGCSDYRAAVFHDLNLDLSAGWDKGFIGKLHGGLAFYAFDTKNFRQQFPIVDLGFTAFDSDRMRMIYASPEIGLRFGADKPDDRHHLALLGSIGGYNDQAHGRGGYFMASGILRGEVNLGPGVLVRGQGQVGVLTGGSADPSTNSVSSMSNVDGVATTTTETTLTSPGYSQNGTGAFESVQCSVEVSLPKNFYAAMNLMSEWQQLSTTDVGLNGAHGATHDDSSHVLGGGIDLGVHFKK